MEVFVSNLPKRQKRRKINAALRNALTEVFGGKAIYEWRQFQKKHVGTITFPTESMGTQFLKRFEHGLAMRQERVKFSISKYSPNPRLVQGLLEKMREMEENGEFDEGIGSSSTSTSASVSFHSIDYGVWASDGTFGRCGTVKRKGILTYNPQTGILQAEELIDYDYATREAFDESGISIDNSIIEEIFVDRKDDVTGIYLTLQDSPILVSKSETAL